MTIPIWFWLAILASVFSGLNNFAKKMAAKHDNDPKAVILWFNIFSTFFAGIMFLVLSDNKFDYGWLFIGSVVVVAVVHIFNVMYKIKGLKYLPTAIFVMSLRVGMMTTLALSEIFIFHNYFTWQSVVGIGAGFLALSLLMNNEREERKQVNWKKGLVASIICVGSMAIISVLRKTIAIEGYDRYAWYFYIFFLSTIFTIGMNYKDIVSRKIFKNTDGVIKFSFWQAGFNFLAQVLGFGALVYGANLVIYSKISSYSIFVTIILAGVIYKEKIFTLRKITAFILMGISLWLFV